MSYSTIIRDYRNLLQSQASAPDYPYEGMPYIGTSGAEDARWAFWDDVEQVYGKAYADAVYRHRRVKRLRRMHL